MSKGTPVSQEQEDLNSFSDNQTKQALIIEDDERLLELFQLWIKRLFSYSVDIQIASTIQTAKEVVDSTPNLDAVFIDRKLPDGSGEEVLPVLQSDTNSLKIMITAVSPKPEIINLDIDDYLTKPITEEDFIKRLLLLQKLQVQNELESYTRARKASLLEYHLDQPEENPLYRLFASNWSYDRLEIIATAGTAVVYKLYTNETAGSSGSDSNVRVSIAGELDPDLHQLIDRGEAELIGELVPNGDSYSWVDKSTVREERPKDVFAIYSFTCSTPEKYIANLQTGDISKSPGEIKKLLESSYS